MALKGQESAAATAMFGSSGSTTKEAQDMMTVIATGVINAFLKCTVAGLENGTIGTPPLKTSLGPLVCPALIPVTLAGVITPALAAKGIAGPALAPFILGVAQLGTTLLTAMVEFQALAAAVGTIVVAPKQIVFTGKDAFEEMKKLCKDYNLVNPDTEEVTEPTLNMLDAIASAVEIAVSTATASVPVVGGTPTPPPVPIPPPGVPNPKGSIV